MTELCAYQFGSAGLSQSRATHNTLIATLPSLLGAVNPCHVRAEMRPPVERPLANPALVRPDVEMHRPGVAAPVRIGAERLAAMLAREVPALAVHRNDVAAEGKR